MSFIQFKEIKIFTLQLTLINHIFKYFFTLDQQVDQYQRTVYSFLDLFGFVGGIYELLKILGQSIVTFFTSNLLYFSILSNLRDSSKMNNDASDHKEGQVFKENSEDINTNNRKVLPIKYQNNEISVQSINRGSNLEEEQKSSVEINLSNNLSINHTNIEDAKPGK